MRHVALFGLAAAAALGCGAAASTSSSTTQGAPGGASAPDTSLAAGGEKAAPLPSGSADAAAAAASGAPRSTRSIPMYPVLRIYSLLNVIATDGGLEVRVGVDEGGGSLGIFRYVPLVNGAPDFDRETDDRGIADTSGFGSIEIAGRRPGLIWHRISGFRSAAEEEYSVLDENDRWQFLKMKQAPGIGEGIFTWTQGRLLEWRGPRREDLGAASMATRLPELRVLQGADKKAPSLPKALEKKLSEGGFSLDTFSVFRTGEVIAIGRLTKAEGFGTVLWTTDVSKPAYFVTKAEAIKEPGDLSILGGESIENIRLQAKDQVMRLDSSAWVVESTIQPGGFPAVWFGKPLLMAPSLDPNAPQSARSVMYARTSEDSPWMPLAIVSPQPVDTAYTVDADGTIWGVEGDLLVSSKKQPKQEDITEEALVMGRKKSVLRGGSYDVTGQPPGPYSEKKCRMHYVLLDKSPIASAPQDFPEIRAALKDHKEYATAKFIVSRERSWQFFGATIEDADSANALAKLLKKRAKASSVLCAEPVPVREIAMK